jgi:hypothetical protein
MPRWTLGRLLPKTSSVVFSLKSTRVGRALRAMDSMSSSALASAARATLGSSKCRYTTTDGGAAPCARRRRRRHRPQRGHGWRVGAPALHHDAASARGNLCGLQRGVDYGDEVELAPAAGEGGAVEGVVLGAALRREVTDHEDLGALDQGFQRGRVGYHGGGAGAPLLAPSHDPVLRAIVQHIILRRFQHVT